MNEEHQSWKHSHDMMNDIAIEVMEWCHVDECTTADAVRLMKAELYETKADLIRLQVYKTYEDRI